MVEKAISDVIITLSRQDGSWPCDREVRILVACLVAIAETAGMAAEAKVEDICLNALDT